jgi:hypothetical protein
MLSLEDFRREVARWWTHWVITKRNDLPTTLCTTLDSVNPVLYPSIYTILIKLCVLLTMPVASATAEMPFSVLRRLKTYVRSTMKNDRLSSLRLMHILTEILKWTCTKQWRCSYLLRHEGQILDNFRKFLSIKVIKIVLDSVIWNLEMAPDRTILHLFKKNPRPPPPLKNYGVHNIKPQLRPCWLTVNQRNPQCPNIAELTSANVEEWRRFPHERPRILVRWINRRVR